MDFTGKLKKLLLLLIIPLTLSACSVSQNYQASANAKQSTATEQLAATIKKDIKQTSSYQDQKHHYQTKVYTRYINGLLEQVKEKKISEEGARNLLIKSYRQFKAGKYHFQEEKLMNEAPTSEEPAPHYIPRKPGAL
ncbi:MAG: hypothetical protein JO149_01240 [Gammaproteobacteria bacterium]|nr:hypothetical protein [Gammaproteobacteria bacterium]